MRKVLLFVVLLTTFLLWLSGCTLTTPEGSEVSAPYFLGATGDEFVKYIYSDGRFKPHSDIAEFDGISYPGGFTTDGTYVVAWEGNTVNIANAKDWTFMTDSYETEYSVKCALTDGEYLYTIENGAVVVYKIGFGSLSKQGSLKYYGAEIINPDWLFMPSPDTLVGLKSTRIYVIDVSDKTAPKISKVIDLDETLSYSLPPFITADGKKVYLRYSFFDTKITMLDFSEPSSPVIRVIKLPTLFSEFFVTNSLLVSNDGEIFSLETGELLADIDVGSYAYAVTVYDNKTFFFQLGGNVTVFDISNPSSPAFVEEYTIDYIPTYFSDVFE